MIARILCAFLFFIGVFGVSSASDGINCTGAESKLWIEKASFTLDLQTCALVNFGIGRLTSACLSLKYSNISLLCSDCFGSVVQCGRDKCLIECLKDTGAPNCVACNTTKGCTASLVECTGFDQVPPNPIPRR